jgi:hypothetical protein
LPVTFSAQASPRAEPIVVFPSQLFFLCSYWLKIKNLYGSSRTGLGKKIVLAGSLAFGHPLLRHDRFQPGSPNRACLGARAGFVSHQF